MARHHEFRASTGSLDSIGGRWDSERFTRERQERTYRSTTVTERPGSYDEDRFERRLYEQERYGPPARRPERYYEDDHLERDRSSPTLSSSPSGPLVSYERPHAEREREWEKRRSSPSPPPRLLRRQSSLDIFDRIPSCKRRDHHYYHDDDDDDYASDYYRSSRAPPVVSPRRASPPLGRYESDYYEDIRIAEPDYYGDDEYRNFRERERRRPRSRESMREMGVRPVEEKPYPRKGKTRMPRRLANARAIVELGYPFEEEEDVIVIQKALSKEQIDEVVRLSREIRRRTKETRAIHTVEPPSPVRERTREKTVERLVVDSHSPRASRDTLIVERSPSRHRSRSRIRGEHLEVRGISRPRSASINRHNRRRSSPVRVAGRQSEEFHVGPLILQERPRRTDREIRAEIRALEDERRALQLVRREESPRGPDFPDRNRDREEIIERLVHG